MSSNSTASRLEQLIGLQGAKKVVRSLAEGKFDTHALLFYGADGSGKSQLAKLVSEYWLCKQPVPGEGADRMCQACQAFTRSTNPDLLMIRPQGAGNMITIKQFQPRKEGDEPVFSMQEFLRTPPLMSRHKVVIISDAERMNGAASNALLKTLEEPPPFAKLILTTQSTGGIRATILSRVLAVACSLPSNQELRELFPSATSDDFMVAEYAPGRIAKVLEHAGPYRNTVEFARSLTARNKRDALVTSEDFRIVADKLDGAIGCGTRLASAEVLKILSLICARNSEFPPHWASNFVQAHEWMIANVTGGLICDSLFARILPG